MAVRLYLLWICACFVVAAQAPSNKSLTGNYWYREIVLTTDVLQIQTFYGSITFDGMGGFSYTSTALLGTNPPIASARQTGGTYTVQPDGSVTMAEPILNGRTVNARLGTQALIGSDTETSNNVFSILVAIPAPSPAITASVLNGTYWIASLEFTNGTFSTERQTLFQMTADGRGGFGSPTVFGQATNLRDTQITQAVSGVTYAINADGSATVNFSAADDPNQLISGVKTVYVSGDGSFFFGGETTAGGQGMLIGIRAGASINPPRLFWSAGFQVNNQSYSSFAGSSFAVDNANVTWSRRLRTNNGLMDVSDLTPYTLGVNGPGIMLDSLVAASANGQVFLGSGLSSGNTSRYGLFLGVQAPAVSGSGMFLNPQAVYNVFSYAPAGSPIAPGEFINIYGTGLPAKAPVSPPFPGTLNGAQLLINNTPAPLFSITSTNIYAIVPYSVTGPTATIVFSNNGAKSNTITVPVSATAPGIASLTQNGLGAGAVTHADGSLVSPSRPATRGETVVIYLTGLGIVSPPATDGAPPSKLSSSNSVQAIYFGAAAADPTAIYFQGLSPQYPGLYQINVTIPLTVDINLAVPLAIQTTNGFTDLVTMAIQ